MGFTRSLRMFEVRMKLESLLAERCHAAMVTSDIHKLSYILKLVNTITFTNEIQAKS